MKNKQASSGLGIIPVLTIIFVVLKLTNNVDWNWFWVFSPVLIPFSLLILILFIGGLIAFFKN